jgi:hypothetical protein
MKQSIEEEIVYIENQIAEGEQPNSNYMDGYVLEGLKEKVVQLKQMLKEIANETR